MAQAFVTGASGVIGGALATRLVDRGQTVVALARSDEAASAVARRGATVAQGDVLDEDSILDGMAGCALAYHVAGVNTHAPADPDLLLRTNAEHRGSYLLVYDRSKHHGEQAALPGGSKSRSGGRRRQPLRAGPAAPAAVRGRVRQLGRHRDTVEGHLLAAATGRRGEC